MRIARGVGVARVKTRIGLNTLSNFLDDSDTVFAWQGIAGIRAPRRVVLKSRWNGGL